jgi:hypothetical protein
MSIEEKETLKEEIRHTIKASNRYWGGFLTVIISVSSMASYAVVKWAFNQAVVENVAKFKQLQLDRDVDRRQHDTIALRSLAQEKFNTSIADSVIKIQGILESQQEAIINIDGRLLRADIK